MNTQDTQREHAFLDFALETGVLRFGEFVIDFLSDSVF